MTLNDVMAVILRYLSEIGDFGVHCVKVWLKIYLNVLRQKCSPKFLVFSDISLTMIREPLHGDWGPSGGLNARWVANILI